MLGVAPPRALAFNQAIGAFAKRSDLRSRPHHHLVVLQQALDHYPGRHHHQFPRRSEAPALPADHAARHDALFRQFRGARRICRRLQHLERISSRRQRHGRRAFPRGLYRDADAHDMEQGRGFRDFMTQVQHDTLGGGLPGKNFQTIFVGPTKVP